MIRLAGPLLGPSAPSLVVTAECEIADVDLPLYPEEEVMTARVVEVRRREIVAGRACARAALAAMGRAAVAIPAGPDRAPQWPDGIVGSIAHTRRFCAVALADRDGYLGLGIDLEPLEPVTREVLAHIASPAEIAALGGLGMELGVAGKLLFSAKEAFYKCQYAVSRTYLGFMDVDAAIGPSTFAITLQKDVPGYARGTVFEGTHRVHDGHIVCVVARPNPAVSDP